jgi:GTP cyclohydrolase II
MNQRILQSEPLPAAKAHDELTAIRVDRAQTELRHGRAVAVVDADGTAPIVLAASVETLTTARLRWLESISPTLRLLITAERAQAMALLAEASHGLSLALPTSPAGTTTVDTLQSLSAVHPGMLGVDRLPPLLETPHSARMATPVMESALVLAKRARLAPALLVAELPATALPGLQEAQVLQVSPADIAQIQHDTRLSLQRVSDARVPIAAHEDCTLVLFREANGDAEHVAIIVGQPDLQQPVPVRLHSSCLTGDLLGSLRCDCGDQLRNAIDLLAEDGGVLLYLAQEGRGTGLASKLRAYRLQDDGLDTIDADRYLGFRADERDFQAAASMLEALGISRIHLLTNNPQKIDAMRRGGIEVIDRLALIAPVNPHNARYIQTKRDRAGHLPREHEADRPQLGARPLSKRAE